MATFNCQCGKVLENCKLGDMIYVFDEQEILAACQDAPDLLFADFLAGWRRWALRDNPNVVYWKCPDCGKVYETEFKLDGQCLRVFERTEREGEVALNAFGDWSKLYVFDSEYLNELDDASSPTTLFDAVYIKCWKYDYFLDPEEKLLVALESGTNHSAFIYEDVDKRG